MCCEDGSVYEMEKPYPSQVDNRESYLIDNYPMKKWKIKMMEF